MVLLSRKLLPLVAAGLVCTAPAVAQTPASVDAGCVQLSPSQAPCTLADKQAEAIPAECRRAGVDESRCVLPVGKTVTDRAVREYGSSWLHRTLAFQQRLGDPLPLLRGQILGTHNSFNSVNDSPTISHSDSNQQLSLTQQLDIDVRSLELDVHYLPRLERGGASAVTVCHGRGPDQLHAGCTTEPLLTDVLPPLARWLNAPAHRDDVVLLYVEDELGSDQGYADTVAQLEAGLRRPDGSSLIDHPAATGATCTNLPLQRSRADVLASGAQVVLVGNCRAGWKSTVFGWDAVHVESGSTPGYRAFPACDATYGREIYDTKLVRYYEDSTVVAQAIAPTTSPAAAQSERLTGDKVAAMIRCGVNLFGFDQLLPGDGRLAAAAWSWAPNAPDARHGGCAVQRDDGRWTTASCASKRPAACLAGSTWTVTPAVPWAGAAKACADRGAAFALPRTGYENALLRQAAGTSSVWLEYRLDARKGVPKTKAKRSRRG
jgi:hypothetical protein